MHVGSVAGMQQGKVRLDRVFAGDGDHGAVLSPPLSGRFAALARVQG
jgi:hypothetical protein